ncbi:MAG TPA: hypothetical protein VNP36_12915 [Burkholderiales bacterium]|nr:hypothetical protein [Burkholderiales bacterium]
MRIAVFAVAAGVALTGCAPTPLAMGKLPPVTDAAQAGEVVVIRPRAFIGDDFAFYLNVNQENVVTMNSREHTRLRLPAGEHRIAIRCTQALKEGWSETAITQRVVAGQTTYLAVTPKFDCASLDALSESDGKKLLSSTTLRPL